jgi:hypothetical protein
VNGYKLVRSPDVDPNAHTCPPGASPAAWESPQLTWGDVLSTPLHIREEDSEPGQLSGSGKPTGVFRVPETPSREEIAQRLSNQASKAIKERELRRAGSLSSTVRKQPTPLTAGRTALAISGRNTPGELESSQRAHTPGQLSPAAWKLLQGRHGTNRTGGLAADAELRASYGNSPSIRSMCGHTPNALSREHSPSPLRSRGTPSPSTTQARKFTAFPSPAAIDAHHRKSSSAGSGFKRPGDDKKY